MNSPKAMYKYNSPREPKAGDWVWFKLNDTNYPTIYYGLITKVTNIGPLWDMEYKINYNESNHFLTHRGNILSIAELVTVPPVGCALLNEDN